MQIVLQLSLRVVSGGLVLISSAAYAQVIPDNSLILPGDLPYCYVTYTNGQVINLERLCGNHDQTSNEGAALGQSRGSALPNTANNAVDNLGGLGNSRSASTILCYGFDAQGKPCS